MAVLQEIVDLVEICHLKGIRDVIICPGSRSAALTIAFVRSKKFNCHSVSDERSAAFIGMGIAQMTLNPVVLICTSGSAALNFAPGISEAFFNEVPLLILTADRPAEWIHQYDGQTIYQDNIYGKHVKKGYSFNANALDEDEKWANRRILNEAINLLNTKPYGPCHINIGIKEPFYPTILEEFIPAENLKIVKNVEINKSVEFEQLNFDKILIVCGQMEKDDKLEKLLTEISIKYKIPVVGDQIANISNVKNVIHYQDGFASDLDESFRPDLLISFGRTMISKNFKQFLRKFKADQHWHVQENPNLIDPFQSLTQKIEINSISFLDSFLKKFSNLSASKFQNDFFEIYQQKNDLVLQKIKTFFKVENTFSDVSALKLVLDKTPDNSLFCIGNSMSVRYSNLIPSVFDKNLEVFSNRGTSGIDGCLSTAVGIAMKTTKIVTLLLGDVSFMYDRNGLWNNLLTPNLRIIVLNNGGGNIFKMIDGPAQQPEVNEFFVTNQNQSAYASCLSASIEYFEAANFDLLSSNLKKFYSESNAPKLLEIFTDSETNQSEWKRYKNFIS